MSSAVFVANEQEEHEVDTERWLRLANEVLRSEKIADDVEVSIMYVDEATIAELNERFMSKTGPTDVLSFPIDEGPVQSGRVPDGGGTGPGFDPSELIEDAPSMLGDIVICPAVAKANAPEHAGTYEDELALLLVHGILHLLGMDHIEEADAVKMESRERELLTLYWRSLPETIWSTMSEAGTQK